MIKYPFTIRDFMHNIKPVCGCNFMRLCAAYMDDARDAFDDGDTHFEISSISTKDGKPWVVFFNN